MTPDLARFSHITLELGRAGREASLAQFQPVALELLHSAVRFDSAWWGNAAAEPLEIHRLHLHHCDASILAAYQPYMHQDFMRAALMAAPGRSINLADLTTRARYVRTPLYQAVGRRYKIEWSLGTLLIEPVSGLMEFLTLWRHDPKAPFSESERQVKELLMPHIAEAHRVARLRAVLEDARQRHDRWAVVDERGLLREVHAGFVHWARRHWPGWQGPALPAALLPLLGAEGITPVGPERVEVRLKKGGFRYLRVLRADVLHLLTPREQDIVQRYALGDSHAAIAAALSLSATTVRNHIAHAYRKLAVNNKAELVRRLAQREM